MPLVPCPVCEKQISKSAELCVGCGHPDPFHKKKISKGLGFIFWMALLFGGAYFCWAYVVPWVIDFIANVGR